MVSLFNQCSFFFKLILFVCLFLALHITGMLNVSEKFVFSVSCFTKLTQGILEQQLILADDQDVDVTQLRILLINCQSDKLAQQLEQATHKSTIQTIIIVFASEEHFIIARGYLDRFKYPLLFVEEKGDKIIELFNKYPELKAEVSVKDYKEVSFNKIIKIKQPVLRNDSRGNVEYNKYRYFICLPF